MKYNLRKTRAARAQRARSTVVSIPAPVMGFNARDSIAAMKPNEALKMVNVFPRPTEVEIRHGFEELDTGDGATLMAYNSGPDSLLISIGTSPANANDFAPINVTPNGVDFSSYPTLSTNRFQYINVATPGGNFLYMVSGFDSPYTFDGTDWDTPSITGVDSSLFININLFKNRVWFVERDSLRAWYLPTQSIAGAANQVDLSSLAVLGGYLVAMGTWTIDAGYGMDDYAVFITSQGEVIVFGGTDPSSAATWSLIGVFYIGEPIGYRCFTKFAGDLLVVTRYGLAQMSAALQSSRTNPRVYLTDRISGAIADATRAYGNLFGWEVTSFPNENMVILNVPTQESPITHTFVSTESKQYVMNTITGAWCEFSGYSAATFCVFNNELYFSNDEGVYKAWTGSTDDGTAIDGYVLQSFNYFGSNGQQKRFVMVRPTLMIEGPTAVKVGMNVNFQQNKIATGSKVFPITGAAAWDSGVWDTSLWSDEYVVSSQWTNPAAVGFNGAISMNFEDQTTRTKWLATDVVLEAGAIL